MLQSFLNFLFNTQGFMPHGFCFQWQPVILWVTVVSDLLIFLAYLSIPIALGYFVYQRKDLENKWLFILFSAFIFSCGATHFFAVVNVWIPLYALSSIIKLVTALVSIVTAIFLWPLIPVVLKIPSPHQLQRANQELQDLNTNLDKQIQKRTQELEKNQMYLQHMVSVTPSVIYILKPAGNTSSPFKVIFISDKITELTGFTPDDWYQNNTLWIDQIHPDDVDKVLKNMSTLIAQGHLVHEYQFRIKNGAYCWIRDELIIVYDKNHQVKEAFGSWTDISGYKQTEADLRIAATTFESMQAVLITDAQGKILRANQAFTKMSGYSLADVLGKNPHILQSTHHDESFYKDLWEQISKEGFYEGEFWNRKQSGEIYPVMQSITAVKNNIGETTHHVSVSSNISEQKAKEMEIKELAYYDALTQLPNRRLLTDRIEQELKVAHRNSLFGAVIFLDLDDFKVLNDSIGHHIGDELLCLVADRIKLHLRAEDMPARLGGDEFVILLHASHKQAGQASDEAMIVAHKILRELNVPYILNNTSMNFSSSMGISIYPDGELSALDVMRQADTAMYRSKHEGKNLISFFDVAMQQKADHRIQIESQLRIAMAENQLELVFQPQFANNGTYISAEALLRWNHPQQGMILPEAFIPIAEQSNLITLIDTWVLEKICQHLKEWQEAGLCFGHIAINISSKKIKQQSFVDEVKKILQGVGVSPQSLMLEVTENIFIDKIEIIIDKFKYLNDLGIHFSLDDFGTGYSSLAYLKDIPFQQLKIDRQFIRDILLDTNDEAIVETIIAMANKLDMQVIAEGVETVEQFSKLKLKGCEFYQGYYFSSPLVNAEFVNLIS
ncbi:PAS domain S-box protein [Methyloprofundus sedimenti]|uniref:PAS domain S-box protein n=1 Tax=Methyloprofundus sedimenti TaxID=1420851 RepID=A0A1V8M2X4_9GAMM|nr:GGDEF domain-containing phosphodiesterase [Methyloprofundus sedimenti]OQK15909.1 PAS domain S-box protein [Methyloprofundus sedimenti]